MNIEDNPLYYDIINSFYKKTGCPVVINTSFNVRGEPLVCSPMIYFKLLAPHADTCLLIH